MIRQWRFRRRVPDHRLMVHKSMSRAFKWVVIQPDIIIYGETLRTEDLGRSAPALLAPAYSRIAFLGR